MPEANRIVTDMEEASDMRKDAVRRFNSFDLGIF
jgi:hypothetical protein